MNSRPGPYVTTSGGVSIASNVRDAFNRCNGLLASRAEKTVASVTQGPVSSQRVTLR